MLTAMTANSSLSSNASLPPSSLCSDTNMFCGMHDCLKSTAGIINITSTTIAASLILLPLCIFVLYLGLQRWRQQRSDEAMNHSDVFTYNIVIAELIGVLGFILGSCALHTDTPQVMTVGICLYTLNSTAQMFFHLLTCVERYLAVVHPITYRNLRKQKGIRIRNVSIGCVWLWCFVWVGVVSLGDERSSYLLEICTIPITLIIVAFCSLSVLCVLMRPGPGQGRGSRGDQSKLRAFYTITAILGVLLFRLGGMIVTTAVYTSPQVGATERCVVWLSVAWPCLPSSLLLPLLFLHRAGKLLCCSNKQQ